jgi:hypothetical protein
MHCDKSDLIRKLIMDQWAALQAGRTFVERAGGHPTHLVVGESTLSERGSRKKGLSNYYEERTRRRSKHK